MFCVVVHIHGYSFIFVYGLSPFHTTGGRPEVRSFSRQRNRPQVDQFHLKCSKTAIDWTQFFNCQQLYNESSTNVGQRDSTSINLNSSLVEVGKRRGKKANTLTHLMSQCYSETQLNHDLMYTMDHPFGYIKETQWRKLQIFQNFSRTHKVMEGSPLIHEAAHGCQMVIQGQGSFPKCGFPWVIPPVV